MTPPRRPTTAPEHLRCEPPAPLSHAELKAIIDAAVKSGVAEGIEQAFANLGIANGHAARDIRDLRSVMDAIRTIRRAFVQTLIRVFTTGLILVIMAGLAVKLKLFKGE